jgi:hypothetical protein
MASLQDRSKELSLRRTLGPSIGIDDDDHVTQIVRVHQGIRCELFYIEGVTFLLSIFVPMRFFIVTAPGWTTRMRHRR